jgi:DNA repair exonuclease SbcCD ATPase subunit
MRICISNFRCFKDETVYEFENGKLTLLKGPSGAGKSTIFEALRWCLYGNLRNIQPGSEVKGNVKTKDFK